MRLSFSNFQGQNSRGVGYKLWSKWSKSGDVGRWGGGNFLPPGDPTPPGKPWLLEELYLDFVSKPERLKFLGVSAFLCWMLVSVDQCGCSDNPGHKFGRIQNKIIIIGQNLKNHFPITIFQWNLAQSRRTWIDLYYWNNNLKKKICFKMAAKFFFFRYCTIMLLYAN